MIGGFLTNEQVAERDAARVGANALPATPPEYVSQLGAYVRSKFELAKRERQTTERRMLDAIRQRSSRYSTAKLEAIRQIMGPGVDPPFLAITEAKCEAVYAWLTDGILPPGQFPASIEPTPEPTLPEFVEQEVTQEIVESVAARAEQLLMQGQDINTPTLRAAMEEIREEIRNSITRELLEKARESAQKMFLKIKDQFVEGGWENALRAALHDLVDTGTGIMRGPVLRTVPRRKRVIDPATRRHTTVYTEETIPQWDRLVPLRFYPSPDATRTSMPWYVYLNSSTRRDLSSLLGVEGYDQKALRLALRDYATGYREVTTSEQEKASLEERISTMTSELIDRLEFGGSVPGWLLTQFGIKEELDPEKEYDALVWMVGSYVIKAILNPDPVGLNYIFSAGFAERPDSFWAFGVPDKMKHSQNIANIAARQVVMNAALASGPMAEVNVDRMWPGENYAIRPWMVLRSTNSMMNEGRAVNFYQPNMYTTKLIEIIDFCMRLSDIETGLPRILYTGESSVETASATSMLMSQASKGGQNIIRNIDTGLIIPAVMAQYNYNLQYEFTDEEIFGDHTVVARGSNSMIAKEQKVTRLKEILRDMNNPADLEVAPPEIRAKLWKEAISTLGLDPDLLGKEDELDELAEELQEKRAMQEQMAMQEPMIEREEADQKSQMNAVKMQQMQDMGNMRMGQMQARHNQQMAIQRDKAGTNRTPPAARGLDVAGNAVAGGDLREQFATQRGSAP